MGILSLIEAIVLFFAVIGFFVAVSRLGDIANDTKISKDALIAILKKLENQEKAEQSRMAKRTIKPGESVQL